MKPIIFINRQTGKQEQEKVYGAKALDFLYGNSWLSRCLAPPIVQLSAHCPWISALYGWWQKQPLTARKIKPFIDQYHIDASEFRDPISSFHSFNDFFIRHLKNEARPITPGNNIAVIPADGRYYFYQDLTAADGFIVKGQKFNLATLLNNAQLASEYEHGSLVISRLCPIDYHRFHFPIDGTPDPSYLINGALFSVNPLAIKRNINIFAQNKRTICQMHTPHFGKVLIIEIGATNVGTIHQTYTPNQPIHKGDEKGFFSFGGSSLILLFQKNTIIFDKDLISATQKNLEIRCLMGQSMGSAR